MAFASNKNAYGICDISGFRYRLKDMRKTWDGLLVGPDQYEPKHPQLCSFLINLLQLEQCLTFKSFHILKLYFII